MKAANPLFLVHREPKAQPGRTFPVTLPVIECWEVLQSVVLISLAQDTYVRFPMNFFTLFIGSVWPSEPARVTFPPLSTSNGGTSEPVQANAVPSSPFRSMLRTFTL